MGHRGKFRMRIRKMKPESITRTRTVKRLAWGKSEKKEETVLGTLLVSLICFQIFCINRKNNYEESDDDESVPTTDPEQVQVRMQQDAAAIKIGALILLLILSYRLGFRETIMLPHQLEATDPSLLPFLMAPLALIPYMVIQT